MEIVRLNDGTELEGRIVENGDGMCIYVYIQNITMMQGFMMFYDVNKTSTITFVSYETEHVYEGYTELYSINNEFGNCNIIMRKGVANAT